MTTPCLYSILRYAPNADTEEFINAGVVMCAPKHRFFRFMLAKRNDSRISTFFSNNACFPAIKDAMEITLTQAQKHVRTLADQEDINRFFLNMTTRHESVLFYSPVRIILSADPEAELKGIYAKYVTPPAPGKVRKEDRLNKELKEALQSYDDLNGVFHPDKIGKELTRFTMPFVAKIDGTVLCAIKPLTFTQKTPARMIEHCDKWVTKITRAAEEKILRPGNVLLTVDLPENPTPAEIKAIGTIRKTFERNYLTYAKHSDTEHIASFARRALLAAKPYI